MNFEKEINLIKNELIRNMTIEGVNLIPDYFYSVPASSSGKYHPMYALGDGGLYRHVQAAVAIAKILFTIYEFDDEEQDLILASIILHDGWKQGLDGSGGRTLHEHPLVAVRVLNENIQVPLVDHKRYEYLFLISQNIASHMGQWTTSENSDVVLPEPKSEMQKFVHLCDYIASRRQLEFNFSV